MKNKFMQTAAGAILGLLIVAGSTQLFVSGQESKNESSENSNESYSKDTRIVGTWQTSVTPRNCQTGDPVTPAFPGIVTFNRGGTLSGTSTVVSSAYGIWRRVHGSREYSFAFVSLRYSPAGVFIGTQKVWQTVVLGANGDDFTSTGTVQIIDVNGNTVGTGCATATGTRFE